MTRLQLLQSQPIESGISRIKDILIECKSLGAYGMMIDIDKAATALYDKFCEDTALD